MPSKVPAVSAMSTEKMLTVMLRRAPLSTRLNTSRPYSSPPNKNPPSPIAPNRRLPFILYGSLGARIGPMKARMIIVPITANPIQNLKSRTMRLSIANPRVQNGVREVSEQRYQHVHDGGKQNASLQQ